MNQRDSMKRLVPAVLLASAVAVAEEWHPSGFQPAPVFEDEGLAGRSVQSRVPSAEPAKAAQKESPPQPVPDKPVSAASATRPAPAAAVREEMVAPAAGDTHLSRPEPPPVFEDEGLPGRSTRTPAQSGLPKAPPAAAVPVAKAQVSALAPRPEAAPVGGQAPEAQASEAWSSILAANYPVGLIVLALAGHVFWNIRRGACEASRGLPGSSVRSESAGRTGVTKYLDTLNSSASSASPETGVAKYLRKLG